MRWAPCTMRLQIASAMVGSPITSCQDDTGSCDTINIEARAWRSSRISSSASRARASSGSRAKSSIYSDIGVNRLIPTLRLSRCAEALELGRLVAEDPSSRSRCSWSG